MVSASWNFSLIMCCPGYSLPSPACSAFSPLFPWYRNDMRDREGGRMEISISYCWWRMIVGWNTLGARGTNLTWGREEWFDEGERLVERDAFGLCGLCFPFCPFFHFLPSSVFFRKRFGIVSTKSTVDVVNCHNAYQIFLMREVSKDKRPWYLCDHIGVFPSLRCYCINFVFRLLFRRMKF